MAKNLWIVERMIADVKRRSKELAVVFIDVRPLIASLKRVCSRLARTSGSSSN